MPAGPLRDGSGVALFEAGLLGAEHPLQRPCPGRVPLVLREINIDEHGVAGVQHQRAVAVAGDYAQVFAGGIDGADNFFAQRARESDEPREGIILDYDKSNRLLSIELLDASEQIKQPESVEFALASAAPASPRSRQKSAGH